MRRAILICALACGAARCGGGSPAAPPPPAQNPFRITISASGIVTPADLVVPVGTRVLFVNEHTRRHDMTSDLHPDHRECPELNQVGLLQPGESRETGNLVTARTCGFHDHDNFEDDRLKGRIVIR